MLPYSTTPDAQHVLMASNQQLQPGTIMVDRNTWKKAIGRDPVATTAEDIYVIDSEMK
jgi:multisubunit Na+/H+ antiporter MnhE subunit